MFSFYNMIIIIKIIGKCYVCTPVFRLACPELSLKCSLYVTFTTAIQGYPADIFFSSYILTACNCFFDLKFVLLRKWILDLVGGDCTTVKFLVERFCKLVIILLIRC